MQPKETPASAAAYAPAPPQQPVAQAPFYKRWLGLADAPPTVAPAPAPQAPQPAAAKPADKQRTSELPPLIRGAQPVLPPGFMAYSPINR